MLIFLLKKVYHIGRNLWCKMENRMVKNVCAPASAIDGKIYIIGGTLGNLITVAMQRECYKVQICLFAQSQNLFFDRIYKKNGGI